MSADDVDLVVDPMTLAPETLGEAGASWLREHSLRYEASLKEATALARAAVLIDRLAQLDAILAETGLVTDDGKLSPFAVESRMLDAQLVRTLANVETPIDETDPTARKSIRSEAARKAARARWSR